MDTQENTYHVQEQVSTIKMLILELTGVRE